MVNKDNRIQMGGGPDYEDYDAVASGAITPGMLLEVTAIDDEDETLTVAAHSTDGDAPQLPLFADIVPYSGDIETDENPVDDAYADGDYVNVIGAHRYNRVNAILAAGADVVDSSDATVTDMTGLTSAGDGTLRATTVTAGTTFAHAREAVDNSGAAAGETARLIVEVQ